MKIAFLFGPYCLPRPLDFNHIWDSPRGLSGSDLGILRISQEFVKNGHDVSLFTSYTADAQPSSWEGVKLYRFEQRHELINDTYNCICSWNCPDDMRGLTDKPVRIVCDQLNGFTYCQSGFDEFVDIWTSPSISHMAYNQSFGLTNPNKWFVVPNGCDPETYKSNKVPGRVVSTSSAERGLFWLLSCWPKIRQAVPEAHLRVFYNFEYGDIEKYEGSPTEHLSPQILEFAQRVRYMRYAMEKLKPLGVEHIGSVSRERINQELNEAMVMAFPCNPIAYTEGFSVSVMEALASKTCAVISDADALGQIYGKVVPMIRGSVKDHLDEFADLVIKALVDEKYRNEVNDRCFEFAKKFRWPDIAKQLEGIIKDHSKYKGINNSLVEIKNTDNDNLVKLNICAGTNVFPFTGWINYDRDTQEQYFSHINRIAAEANAASEQQWTQGLITHFNAMPDHQKNLFNYVRNGGKIDFLIHDIRDKFIQHNDNSVDLIYFGQCAEHTNIIYETPMYLKEFHRMLKPGGVLRITTPDLDILIRAYMDGKMDQFVNEQPWFYKDATPSAQLSYLMFGALGPNSTWTNYEGHMHLFTRQSITAVLKEAGFNEIIFYDKIGESKSDVMAKECVDAGISHSLICEAIK